MAIMKCLYCGNEFEKPKGSKKKYCSHRCCTYASQKRTLTPEKKRVNNKEFRRLNPDYMKIWRRNHRTQENKRALDYNRKVYEECKRLIGDKCIICNSPDTICFHEKHGTPHIKSANWIRKHPENFIPLCRKHHAVLHRLIEAKNSGLLEKLLELVKLSMDKLGKGL